MPYTKGGPYVVAGSYSSANANNAETQFDEATQSLDVNVVAAFVLFGGVGTIHGGLPKQMDVTTCVYLVTQADGISLRWRTVNATNFTTVTASATYFLDYNPDGSTSFATSHSGVTGHLTIASVTTDGSGNISVITDARVTTINLFPSAVGLLQFNNDTLAQLKSAGGGAAGVNAWEGTTDPGGSAGEGDIWVKAMYINPFRAIFENHLPEVW